MPEQDGTMLDFMSIIAGSLMAMRAEIRAMRLEAQEVRAPLSEADKDELTAAQLECDELSALFHELPELGGPAEAQA